MKYITSLFTAMIVSVASFADGIPDDLHVKPVAANEISGHEWFYEPGMDFDAFNYKLPAEANGVSFYLGVAPGSSVETNAAVGGSIPAVIFDQPVVLYKRCDSAGKCSFNNIVDTGVVISGRPMWVHVWVVSDEAQRAGYISWLKTVKFVDHSSK